ncbi:hypothetical protein [Streptomyces sp. NPDC005143]
MAAVSLDAVELESLVEGALLQPNIGFMLLNKLRVANGKAAYPGNFGVGDLPGRPADGVWRMALAGVQRDLEA